MKRLTRILVPITVLGLAGPLDAAVLLPGSLIVSGRDRLLMVDPGRRPPEVVSSAEVGGGEPYPLIYDLDLGRDGYLYAVVPGPAIYRIDPATGDRELLSSSDRGQGPSLVDPRAIEVSRGGAIYIGDNERIDSTTYRHRILSVDPVSGDRTLLAEASTYGAEVGIGDLAELDDGRLLVSAGSSNPVLRGLWMADLASGAFRFARRFEGIGALNPRPGTDRTYAIAGSSSGVRIVETDYDVLSAPTVREILSCGDEDPGLAQVPRDLALDADGFLVASTSGIGAHCSIEGLPRLAGRIYRVDPASGGAELLYESEIVYAGETFGHVLVVPEDQPFDDRDGDRVADVIDNCPLHFNAGQQDLDGDGVGDACNDADDFDGDEIADGLDDCPETPDPLQVDADGDGVGDVCDPFPDDPNNEAAALRVGLAETEAALRMCLDDLPMDADGDGVVDPGDRCPLTPPAALTDDDGCSLEQFCAIFDPAPSALCVWADWRDDDPGRRPRDCRSRRDRCVPR